MGHKKYVLLSSLTRKEERTVVSPSIILWPPVDLHVNLQLACDESTSAETRNGSGGYTYSLS